MANSETWLGMYRQKLKSLDEAVRTLPDNAAVVMGMASMESQGFMGHIHLYKEHFSHLRILSCLNLHNYEFCENKAYEGVFMNENWFYGPSNRAAVKHGYKLVDYIPNNLHQAGTNKIIALKEEGVPIVYWGPVTPMQVQSGFFNIGLCNVYEKEFIEAADYVVFEVNTHVPWINGDTEVSIKDVDCIVEYDAPIPEIPVTASGEVEKQIARHIEKLIPDGATLQIGIGGIPNAVASLLGSKNDLGIHTEMFTESMIGLYEAGVITNKRKTLWPGKFVFAFALGSRQMYDWLDHNPAVLEMRGNYVNDPSVVAQNDRMISINTSLSVDLLGQVCSESIGTVQYSGTGGQLDTHRGAQKSRDGKGIIAMRSTAKNGEVSTITPILLPGSAVTIPRQDIDWVVTEYGAVHLRGRTLAERVELLVSIAHPKFRDELTEEARRLKFI